MGKGRRGNTRRRRSKATCISFRILAVNEVDAYVIFLIQNIPLIDKRMIINEKAK